eukprot:m.228851 g.228851  ORF g.228851 m.228851 type:complete len:118 (+) comp15983_c0_seq7:169-522(+)
MLVTIVIVLLVLVVSSLLFVMLMKWAYKAHPMHMSGPNDFVGFAGLVVALCTGKADRYRKLAFEDDLADAYSHFEVQSGDEDEADFGEVEAFVDTVIGNKSNPQLSNDGLSESLNPT